MITPRPTSIHRAIIARYLERRAKRRFSRVLARGLEGLAPWGMGHQADAGKPVPLVLLANHSTWWDAVLPVLISLRWMRQDAYAIMDAGQLARFPFFRRAGVFSVDRGNPRSAMRTLAFAADLLRGTRRALWMFPQGVITPNDARPLRCQSGAAHLIRRLEGCAVATVAFRYEVGRDELPLCCVSIARPRIMTPADAVDTRALTGMIAHLLQSELDALRGDMLAGRYDSFTPALRGTGSISERWARGPS